MTEYINCESSVIINPDPGASYANQIYEWNGPGVSGQISPVFEAVQAGTYTVTAIDTTGANCPTTESFDVVVLGNPDVQIDIVGDGCGTSVQLNTAIAQSSARHQLFIPMD